MDKLTRTGLATLASVLLTGCGSGPPGTLAPDAGDVKLSVGTPANPGHDLTLVQMGVTWHDGQGIVIESIEPLHLHGNARYLGGALYTRGYGQDLSPRFPHLAGAPSPFRLPHRVLRDAGTLNVGVGFRLSRPGVTNFAGIALRYRQHGREYVAVIPLGGGICVHKVRSSHPCKGAPIAEVPPASVRRA